MFTAQFLGTTNLVPGTVEDVDVGGRLNRRRTALGRVIGVDREQPLAKGAKVHVSIRPEDLAVQEPGQAARAPARSTCSKAD